MPACKKTFCPRKKARQKKNSRANLFSPFRGKLFFYQKFSIRNTIFEFILAPPPPPPSPWIFWCRQNDEAKLNLSFHRGLHNKTRARENRIA